MFINCHSYYSFRFGAMSPEQLLSEAKQKGHSCLALTDINNTSGILDFFRLAPQYEINPVGGIDFRNGITQKFIGLARNHEGFYELNAFLSKHLQTKEKIPDKAPPFKDAFTIYPFSPDVFVLKENEFIGIKPSDLNKLTFSGWKKHPDKLVLLAPVTFRHKIDFNAHRLLRALDHNIVLSKLPGTEQGQPDEMMVTKQEMEYRYRNLPQLIYQTNDLLNKCALIDFEFGKNKNKRHFTGKAASDRILLTQLCEEGLHYRYPKINPDIRDRLNKEIHMISEKDFISYFLINQDIVQYARHRGYFYVGRGSGANSIVAYLLRITDVDPVDLDLYFERFINPSRANPPDFDIDFNWQDRDDIINYIFKKHGKDHTALLATYSTFQEKAVIRELGKVFGLSKNEIDALADERKSAATLDHISKLIFQYSRHIHDFPNHLSVHAGGILISEKPIYYYTATNISSKNHALTQFSMLEAEDVGLYKFDILSQRGLGKIKDAIQVIRQNTGIEVDIHDVSRFKEDKQVNQNLKEANLMGCFYVESPGMRMLLTKLRASKYLDLVAASSIIRPGVAQSGMMREYILRFHDPSRRKYVHKELKVLMEETFGIMVYQEDVIKVAHHFAKLTLSESDLLRRGMSGKYRGREEFREVKEKFFSNCKLEKYPDEVSKEVWRQIESFAGYAFSKGHSASYAVASYQCMYLKTYFPLEFMVSVINNEGGFFAREFYIHEARMLGAIIEAPDVNQSEHYTTIEKNRLFLGFSLIAGLEESVAHRIPEERRKGGSFLSLGDFMQRIPISIEQLQILIRIGAFRFTQQTKKQLLWDIYSIIGSNKKTTGKKELFQPEQKRFILPTLFQRPEDDAFDEIELLGFPLSSPFRLLKEKPLPLLAHHLKEYLGKAISITGYFVTRKTARTKQGQEMNFGTFIDVAGHWIDTTHFPDVLTRYPFSGKGCYLITGKVVVEFEFYSIDVTEMKRLDYVSRSELVESDVPASV